MKPALLLVDLQNDFLRVPGLQPAAEVLIARAAVLLTACRRHSVPAVHVWTTVRRDDDRRLPHWREAGRWICVAGTEGHQPPAPLRPHDGESVIHKTGFNAFAGPELDALLRRLNCDTAILAGLHLHACVRTAAVECLERGLRVRIAGDAVGSDDPVHAAATRRWLASRCVSFDSTDALLAQLEGRPLDRHVHRSPRRTDEVLFEVAIGGSGEIVAATKAAQGAAADWRRTGWPARQQLLENLASRLQAAAADLARQMASEIGKPLAHGAEEVRRAAANVRDVLRRAATEPFETSAGAGTVRHRPLGVVGVISAWNNPVAIPIGKIAPALAYGNAVIWKPAPAATGVAEAVLKLLREAGVGDDLVRLVTGDHTTAQRLAADEFIDAVTLTGSLTAGYAIQEICARRVVPLQAELSGNNAAIVWSDAEAVSAAAQVAWGAFAFAGQRCTANRRVIVPAARVDQMLDELKIAAERLPWGDPLEPATEIGPVIDAAKRDEVHALATDAERAGFRVIRLHAGRARESWMNAGAYATPAIVLCDRPEHVLAQEETMGPLLVVQPAEDFDHALALCNGVRHGLSAALFSDSPGLREKFLEQAQAGVLKLNGTTAGVDPTLPFGGWKMSGIGPPEHGEGDRLFYTRTQAVYDSTS